MIERLKTLKDRKLILKIKVDGTRIYTYTVDCIDDITNDSFSFHDKDGSFFTFRFEMLMGIQEQKGG